MLGMEKLLLIVSTVFSGIAAVVSLLAYRDARLARQPKANVTFFKRVVMDRLGKRTEYKVKAVNVGSVRIEIMKVGLQYKCGNKWISLGEDDARHGGPFPCVLDEGSEKTFDVTGLVDSIGPFEIECACVHLSGGRKMKAKTLV